MCSALGAIGICWGITSVLSSLLTAAGFFFPFWIEVSPPFYILLLLNVEIFLQTEESSLLTLPILTCKLLTC